MAVLILRDSQGHEVGRREMSADERYALYRLCSEHECLSFQGAQYQVLTVAWCIPEHECRCQVRFEAWEPQTYCDD